MLDRRIRNSRLLLEEGIRQLPRDTSTDSDCSFLGALRTLIDNPSAGQSGTGSSPEVRASQRIAERMGRPPAPGTMFFDVGQRDMTVASASGGGYLVGTETAPGDIFVSALRANSVATALGVRELPLERANAAIPKITNDITTYWLTDEGTQVTKET
jgi:hypothetical protein